MNVEEVVNEVVNLIRKPDFEEAARKLNELHTWKQRGGTITSAEYSVIFSMAMILIGYAANRFDWKPIKEE